MCRLLYSFFSLLPSYYPYSFLVPYFFLRMLPAPPLCAARRGYNLLSVLYRRPIIYVVCRPRGDERLRLDELAKRPQDHALQVRLPLPDLPHHFPRLPQKSGSRWRYFLLDSLFFYYKFCCYFKNTSPIISDSRSSKSAATFWSRTRSRLCCTITRGCWRSTSWRPRSRRSSGWSAKTCARENGDSSTTCQTK